MGRLLYLLFFMLLLGGCSQYVYLSQTLPPEIIINNPPKRITFINQYDYAAHTDKHRPAIAFQTGVQELGKYLSAHSQNDSIVTFTFNDTLSTERVAVGDSNQLLPADKVISLCKQYHSDLLLTLDSLNFDFTYEIEVSESDNGKKSRTAVYYLHGYYYLTLYDEAGELLKRTYLHQSMQYATRPVIAWIVPVFEPKNLDKALDEIIKLTDGSAKEYVGMFFSQTVASSEKLYKGKAFNQSNSLILAKKYDEAIVLLKKISNSGDAKVAQKAMHNLSVAEELRKNL